MFEGQLSGCPSEGARGGIAVWTDFLEKTKQHTTPIIDLEDSGTIGVLLEMLTKAYAGDFTIGHFPKEVEARWCITATSAHNDLTFFFGPTLGSALAQALLAEWRS
jgi:hypothetical protein